MAERAHAPPFPFMSELIIVENISRAVVLRFNRPALKNPLSIAALELLRDILNRTEADANVTGIIFTGTRDAFASGANLNEIAAVTEKTAREFALRGQNLMRQIYHSRKLTIAAVNGFCLGGALDLALSCKIRVASPQAVFAHPGANLGIMTGWSGTQMLPRIVGEALALEMFLTAKRITAQEALRINLIDAISDDPLEFSLANFRAPTSS